VKLLRNVEVRVYWDSFSKGKVAPPYVTYLKKEAMLVRTFVLMTAYSFMKFNEVKIQ
jgi:hypothetical protein